MAPRRASPTHVWSPPPPPMPRRTSLTLSNLTWSIPLLPVMQPINSNSSSNIHNDPHAPPRRRTSARLAALSSAPSTLSTALTFTATAFATMPLTVASSSNTAASSSMQAASNTPETTASSHSKKKNAKSTPQRKRTLVKRPLQKEDDAAHQEAPHNDDTTNGCCICLSSSQQNPPPEMAGLSSCEHVFCTPCILQWSQTENSCPLCKRRFSHILPLSQEEKPLKKKKKKRPKKTQQQKIAVAHRTQRSEAGRVLDSILQSLQQQQDGGGVGALWLPLSRNDEDRPALMLPDNHHPPFNHNNHEPMPPVFWNVPSAELRRFLRRYFPDGRGDSPETAIEIADDDDNHRNA